MAIDAVHVGNSNISGGGTNDSDRCYGTVKILFLGNSITHHGLASYVN